MLLSVVSDHVGTVFIEYLNLAVFRGAAGEGVGPLKVVTTLLGNEPSLFLNMLPSFSYAIK